MLTGQNGILTQAQNASAQTEIAEAKEKAQMDILAWQSERLQNGQDATLNDETVKTILTGKDYVKGTPRATSFVSTTGHTIPYADLYDRVTTIAEEKAAGTVFSKNTTLQDDYGNIVKVPEGFKIENNSPTKVTEGIVIEDVNNGATAGSQFVWIPVGTVYTNEEHTNPETIKLSRYTFDDLGNETEVGAEPIDSGYGYSYEELSSSTYGNAVAKSITTFLATATNSHGYYIGRYEARTTEERSNSTNDDGLTQITVKPNDYVYNNVTQMQAAKLSQEMYAGKSFTSDLVNSYAWDTAIVFIQKFEDDDYSKQTSLNQLPAQDLAKQGTNNTSTQDEVCKIWDMASNCGEWTTETCSKSDFPCVYRGGLYNNSIICTSVRELYRPTRAYVFDAFRPLLYL